MASSNPWSSLTDGHTTGTATFRLPSRDPSFRFFTSHKLCEKCEGIFADIRLGEENVISKEEHYIGLERLQASAHGCQLCLLFWSQWKTDDKEELIQLQTDPSQDSIDGPINCHTSVYEVDGQWAVDIVLHRPNPDRVDTFEQIILRAPDPRGRPASLDSQAPNSWTSKTTGSHESLDLAKRWLWSCAKEHKACAASSQSDWLPTRLLLVTQTPGSDIEARLVLRKEVSQPTKYITLSHCWGTVSPDDFKLTAATFNLLRKGVTAPKLRKNYIDAIKICRAMGINYLWIDSLCIIQDSTEDWRNECSHMGNVYKRSFCSIAASSAEDGSVGCFFDRNVALADPLYLEPHGGTLDGHATLVGVAKTLTGRLDQKKEPLYRRAWVFQEWFLAPRILHFTRDMIIWECLQGTANEAYPHIKPHGSHDFADITTGGHWDGVLDSRIKYHHASTGGAFFEAFEDWFGVYALCVRLYTRMRLTETRDKLPAFSGIAKEFQLRFAQSFTNPEYIAGLWKPFLIQQLRWRRTRTEGRRPFRTEGPPSWAWTSMQDCQIDLTDIFFPDEDDRFMVTLLEHRVFPVGQDPFQELKGGILTMEGWLWKLKKTDAPPSTHLELFFDEQKDGRLHGKHKQPLTSDVWLLPIMNIQLVFEGLILSRQASQNSSFTRLGVFRAGGYSDRSPLTSSFARGLPWRLRIPAAYANKELGLRLPDEGEYEVRQRDESVPDDHAYHLAHFLYTVKIT